MASEVTLTFYFHLNKQEYIEVEVNYRYGKFFSYDDQFGIVNNACDGKSKDVDESLYKNPIIWTKDEQLNLLFLINEYGCHWSEIKKFFPNRTVQSLSGQYRLHLKHLHNFKELSEEAKSMKVLKVIRKDTMVLLIFTLFIILSYSLVLNNFRSKVYFYIMKKKREMKRMHCPMFAKYAKRVVRSEK